jgi:hypothetical protein
MPPVQTTTPPRPYIGLRKAPARLPLVLRPLTYPEAFSLHDACGAPFSFQNIAGQRFTLFVRPWDGSEASFIVQSDHALVYCPLFAA